MKNLNPGVSGLVCGIIGIILNAIGLLGSIGFVVIGIVSKILALTLS